jgi:D-aspartate ligase
VGSAADRDVVTHVSTRLLRPVTVLDPELPPGIAFVRSLGRAGIPVVACSARRFPAGRFSRHAAGFRPVPPVRGSDDFVAWLVDEIGAGRIDLVAPTSDRVVFCVAEAMDQLGRPASDAGLPPAEGIRSCLFKGRFAAALARLGFPTPTASLPATLFEALAAAETIGYPVLLKPRSHVGIGDHRGTVVRSAAELAAAYRPFEVGPHHRVALRHVPELRLPMVQRYLEPEWTDVISVSGCLDAGGEVVALSFARKVSQAPARVGVGTIFEPIGPQPFTAAAVDVVRNLLGRGLFELEILVDRRSGEYFAIDLNPRGFGQISLDIALGNDLPRWWYRSATGVPLLPGTRHDPVPQQWQDGFSVFASVAVTLARGPTRRHAARVALERARLPSVGVAFDRRDPLPGVLFALGHLRHPRSFLRQLLQR